MTSAPTAGEHEPVFSVQPPDISGIAIEDDVPVDNIYSEKQQRLLTEPLYGSWEGPLDDDEQPRDFLATANVGVFASPHDPPLVPDVLLSLDVKVHSDFERERRHRTYFVWEFGKPPDVVIEVVSNREGDELGKRCRGYARMRVAYYVVWDPANELGSEVLHTFELRGDLYVACDPAHFGSVGLGLVPWEGSYEGVHAVWLRWVRPDGTLVPTGAERADTERSRADAERARADAERARADRLAELLRAQGIDPG